MGNRAAEVASADEVWHALQNVGIPVVLYYVLSMLELTCIVLTSSFDLGLLNGRLVLYL